MMSQHHYNFVILLHHQVVVRDVQARVINASLLTNLAMVNPR